MFFKAAQRTEAESLVIEANENLRMQITCSEIDLDNKKDANLEDYKAHTSLINIYNENLKNAGVSDRFFLHNKFLNNIYLIENDLKELSGDTYSIKEEIKAAGGKWDQMKKTWIVPAAKYEELLKLMKK